MQHEARLLSKEVLFLIFEFEVIFVKNQLHLSDSGGIN